MYCKYCGQPIDDDSTFCSHCGKNITVYGKIYRPNHLRTQFKGNCLVNKNDSTREKKENWH